MAIQERFGTCLGIDVDVYDDHTLIAALAGSYINVVALLLTADAADAVSDILDGDGGTVLFSHKHDEQGGVNCYVPSGFIRNTTGNALILNVTPDSGTATVRMRGFCVYEYVKDQT